MGPRGLTTQPPNHPTTQPPNHPTTKSPPTPNARAGCIISGQPIDLQNPPVGEDTSHAFPTPRPGGRADRARPGGPDPRPTGGPGQEGPGQEGPRPGRGV